MRTYKIILAFAGKAW